jgi:hypothetical protein
MYGSGAFFDLDATGHQTKVADRLANDLAVGETCVVASLDITGNITFDWYKFSHEIIKPDDKHVQCHAYFGEHFKTEKLPRDNARCDAIYSKFFNVNGHFKRPSVLRAS